MIQRLEALSPVPEPLMWPNVPGEGVPGVSPLLLGEWELVYARWAGWGRGVRHAGGNAGTGKAVGAGACNGANVSGRVGAFQVCRPYRLRHIVNTAATLVAASPTAAPAPYCSPHRSNGTVVTRSAPAQLLLQASRLPGVGISDITQVELAAGDVLWVVG